MLGQNSGAPGIHNVARSSFLNGFRSASARGLNLAEFGHIWSLQGQIWPKSGQLWSISGRFLTEFGPLRDNFGQLRANSGRHRPQLDQSSRSWSKIWAHLARRQPTSTGFDSNPGFDQHWAISTGVGPTRRALFDSYRRDFRRPGSR